jgi:hypothetical protein
MPLLLVVREEGKTNTSDFKMQYNIGYIQHELNIRLYGWSHRVKVSKVPSNTSMTIILVLHA